jgi:glycosyltransferase involved in cell wall biosynthesis
MACGTPVVAWRCGSAPEVIEDGETGFLVDSLEEACAAVARCRTLSRAAVRARFELRFSATVMARRYVELYSDRLARMPFAPEVAANGISTQFDDTLAQTA